MVSSVGSKGTQRRVLCPTLLQNRFLCCKNSPLQVLTHILHVQLYILQYCFTNKRESIFFTFEIIPCSFAVQVYMHFKTKYSEPFHSGIFKSRCQIRTQDCCLRRSWWKEFRSILTFKQFHIIKISYLKELKPRKSRFQSQKKPGLWCIGRCRMHELGKSLGLNLNLPEPV